MRPNFLSALNVHFYCRCKYLIRAKTIINASEQEYKVLYAMLSDVISECETLDDKRTEGKFNSEYYSLAIYVFQILKNLIDSNNLKNIENVKKVEKELREKYLAKYQINLLPFRFHELRSINADFLKCRDINIVYFSSLRYYKKNEKVISNRKTIKNLEQLLCILRYD